MFGLPLGLVVSFAVFTSFLFYQQKHVSTFRGRSKTFVVVLSIWVFAGFLFELGVLGYVGYSRSVWAALKLFFLSIVLWMPVMAIEVRVTTRIASFPEMLSLCGFLAMPVCAYGVVTVL